MGDFNAITHEHISYFTKETFANVAKYCGLRIINSTSEKSRFYCLVESCDQERVKILKNNSDIFVNLEKKFAENIQYFQKQLNIFSDHNQKIAFHGACNGLTNILSLSHFQDKFLGKPIYLFDGDERKTGKYLPMLSSPIIDSRDKKYRKVDQVIITAMTYYKPIKKFLVSYHGIDPERIHPLYPTVND
jgi:hypothetical protein